MLEPTLRFSIQHRWLILMLTLGLAVWGVHSFTQLPIDAVPDITNNQVQINTSVPALSPTEIERQVTFPIETVLAGIEGLEYTRSLSRNGFSQVVAVFRDGLDIYFARQQVSERIASVSEDLPPGAEPMLGPIATGLGEIYVYVVEYDRPAPGNIHVSSGEPGWQSDDSYLTPEGERLVTEVEQAAYLRTVQEWIIAPQLRQVEGVAGVDAIGGYVKQFTVEPDPMRLVAYGLTFQDLIDALERNNTSTGAGYIEEGGESFVVRADGRIRTPQEIGAIVVGTRGGTPIRVRDVARAGTGRELRTGSATENGREVVAGTALMRLGANSRTVAAAVHGRMEEVRRTLPPGVTVRTVLNRTELVDSTIRTVIRNLSEGALFVIGILFLLLGNFRAALITALVIPLSMLLAGIGMVRLGISGNLMSLGAIDFGIIVDGAVIVVENCLRLLAERQRALGRPLTLSERLHEVMVASRQMIQPSVFGQAIIITVYLPVLALAGVEGKMFHPMAMAVILALLGAFVLSLTFVPAMVAICVRGRVSERESPVILAAKRVYAPAVRFAVRLRWLVVTGAVAVFLGAAALFGSLGQVFIPTLDEGNVVLQSLRIPGTGLTQSTVMQMAVERAISQLPEVALMLSKTGTTEVAFDPMPPSISDGFVILRPREEWPDPALTREEIQERIEETVASFPGNSYETSQPIQLRFNELISGIRSDVAVKVFGDDFEAMLPVAQEIARLLETIPGAQDVKVEPIEGLPFLSVEIDREAAARHGLNIADIQEVVAIAVGGREAGAVFEGDRRFDLIVRLPDALREDRLALENLPVPLPSGEGALRFVPLSTVARLTVGEDVNQVSRENGKRRIVVQANVRGRDLGGFVAEAQQRLAAEVAIPPGMWLDWGGQFENLASARQRLALVIPLCFFLIFILLFSTFNSVKYALMVFTGVPLALTGGVAALWLTGMPFSISAAVGFIALSGVATLNGLVMVSHINHLRREGLPVEAAVIQGSVTRLRPVLMTALVAALGFIPMALAHGKGAEVQKPLATVVIGGIITSTLLTLVVLPALYRLWHRRDEQIMDETDQEHLTRAAPTVT
ncbi:MAG: CusA/CzcA family heavy metal efflux RND transporter [Candidatus Sumerlaeia bacterium]|nr:CusA/CzcA family heavy metal efflux RND transporter [Candidatus Sumerlaeia bacterium]